MIKKNRAKALSSLTFIFMWVGVLAQENKYVWKEATEKGYTYTYVEHDPTNSRFYKLKNGLTVILSPNKKKPRIQTYIATKAGSKTDPQDHTGLAHYLEHMLFKGTDTFGSLDWSKEQPLLDKIDALYEKYNSTKDESERKAIYQEIDRVSGEAAKFAIPNEYDKLMSNMGSEGTNAFTSFEQTVYIEDIPNNVVDKYLAVQAERFRAPVLRLFHTELEAVYEEKNMSLDRDNDKVQEIMFEALFPNHNYGKQTVLGTVEHLKNPSLKAMKEYFKTYYVPNNMGIIMSGDFEPSEMIKKIDGAFAYMKAKVVPVYSFQKEKPIEHPIVREVRGPNAEFLCLGFRFPGTAHKDSRMLNLLGSILTNGSAGLIDLDLVKSQKLLSASAFPYVLKDYSMLLLEGNPSQGQSLDDVRDLLLATLDKLRKGEFSEDLITSIINNDLKYQIQKKEDYKNSGAELMSAFTSEIDWADELGAVDRLKKITKEDVVNFANKYLSENNYVVLYKRQGTDTHVVKIEKPTITPITVNRDAQSSFLKKISSIPEEVIQPVWIDYNTVVEKGKLKDIDVAAVKNNNNALFNLTYLFPIGQWDSRLLPLAIDYLSFIGTKDKNSEEFSRAFYKLASTYSITAQNEETMLSVSGLNEHFDSTLLLIHDLLHNCVIDDAAFQAYLSSVKKNRVNLKKNKSAIMQGLKAYAKYGSRNPFNNVFTDEELDQLRATDLIKVLHDLANTKYSILYYGPQSVNQLIATLPTLKQTKTSYTTIHHGLGFIELPTVKNHVLLAQFDMKQVDVYWYRNAGRYNSLQTPVVSLFNNYFGGGMGSVVFQTIRESKALAYSTYAYFGQAFKKNKHSGVSAFVGTQVDKFNDAIDGMNELLNILPESAIALETAQVSLIKSLASERITDGAILNHYIAEKELGSQIDSRKAIYEQARKFRFEDLKTFHTKEFSNKPFVYCVVGNLQDLKKEDLEKRGEVKTLSLSEIFGY